MSAQRHIKFYLEILNKKDKRTWITLEQRKRSKNSISACRLSEHCFFLLLNHNFFSDLLLTSWHFHWGQGKETGNRKREVFFFFYYHLTLPWYASEWVNRQWLKQMESGPYHQHQLSKRNNSQLQRKQIQNKNHHWSKQNVSVIKLAVMVCVSHGNFPLHRLSSSGWSPLCSSLGFHLMAITPAVFMTNAHN